MRFYTIFFMALVSFNFSSCQKKPQGQVMSSIVMKEFGGDFILQSSNGKWKLSDHRGKVSLIYFGFTHCPDICPMSLSLLNKELEKLPNDKRKEIQVIFISVDHKRDDAKNAQKYASFFNNNFIGLSGSKKQIDHVTKKYGVYYEFTPLKDSELKFTVDHTSRFFVLDKKGNYLNSFTNIKNNPEFIKTLNKAIGD